MRRVRSVLFWLHLVAGLAVGLVVLLMSVTGALLAFELQIVRLADSGLRRGPAAGETRRSLVELAQAAGGREPTAITLESDPAAPAELRLGRRERASVDPYAGRVLGQGSRATREFFSVVVGLHRWLAFEGESRAAARQVTGVSNLVFLGLILTGLVLWLPRRLTWRAIRPVLWFKGGLPSRTRDWNWHNVLGVWFALPLAFVVVTGAAIGYDWAGDALRSALFVERDPPPPRREEPGESADLAARMDRADAALSAVLAQAGGDWRAVTLNVPDAPSSPLTFTLDRGNGRQPQKKQDYTVDRDTLAVTPAPARSADAALRGLVRFGHTGEYFGLPGQVVALLACLSASVLVYTGVALSFRRLVLAPLRRRRRHQAAAETRPG